MKKIFITILHFIFMFLHLNFGARNSNRYGYGRYLHVLAGKSLADYLDKKSVE